MPTPRPKTERKKKTTTVVIPADSANDSPRVSEGDIALKAFAYYCERGCQDGGALDDWLRAERELRAAATVAKRA